MSTESECDLIARKNDCPKPIGSDHLAVCLTFVAHHTSGFAGRDPNAGRRFKCQARPTKAIAARGATKSWDRINKPFGQPWATARALVVQYYLTAAPWANPLVTKAFANGVHKILAILQVRVCAGGIRWVSFFPRRASRPAGSPLLARTEPSSEKVNAHSLRRTAPFVKPVTHACAKFKSINEVASAGGGDENRDGGAKGKTKTKPKWHDSERRSRASAPRLSKQIALPIV
ncbi:protein SCARECROW-like protein [Anopheles sinensis]|uniref:Protein SCARECROW-like protein n=1 Tax=Anopheles sinensis TaxID=74873 RepID=A0A084W160_ANOSI|nr:protein SCARECROW-like protein [Anopheles sinensis]